MNIEQANQMTAQELCDYAVENIVEQGGRSYDDATDSCLMISLNLNGRRCAFSWTLDKNDSVCMKYTDDASTFIEHFPEKTPHAFRDTPDIATYLQTFHDYPRRVKRECCKKKLNELGINTSAPQWQAWIDMGEK